MCSYFFFFYVTIYCYIDACNAKLMHSFKLLAETVKALHYTRPIWISTTELNGSKAILFFLLPILLLFPSPHPFSRQIFVLSSVTH